MSIAAIINKVTQKDSDLILDLMSRDVGGLRGQPRLTIKNFSHVPQVGQEIWGGSGQCIIEPGQGVTEKKEYRRISLTQLVER